MPCLDDNVAVEFASGSMQAGATAKVEAHLATCRDCRMLVAALAPAPGDPDSDLATPVRPALGKRGARDLALASTDARRGSSEPRRPVDPVVAVGDTIGRYVVLRRIGAGGMGVVFAAYDPQLDRRVALKLLRTGMGLGEGEARARLVREAQAIAQLSHPHVVAVYDVGTAADGDVYIAMEFVEGDTLTNWLSRWERSWRDVVAMFVDAGRGLAAAHAVGLLHRDFKPDNVLVGADGRVRVTDFGLARSLVTGGEDSLDALPRDLTPLRVTLTATGAVMGTPRYMAPEQLAGKDISAAADQFSFCVALYEAVFGVHPILGDTAAKMLEEGARMRPPPEGRGAPAALIAVVARGLDPVPARRFPSMSALLAEIDHAIRPPRRRYVAFAGAAALVLGGAAAATVLGRGSPPLPLPPPAQADNQVVEAMQREIQVLRDEIAQERREKMELIDRLKTEVDNEARVEELAAQVTERNTRIKQLEQQLEEVAAQLPGRRPPPPPVGRAAPQVKAAVAPIVADLQGCFREWADRTAADAGKLTVRVRIAANGHVLDATAIEFNPDRALSECVEAAGRRIVLPASDVVTSFDLRSDYDPDGLQVDAVGVVSTKAPERIETERLENGGPATSGVGTARDL